MKPTTTSSTLNENEIREMLESARIPQYCRKPDASLAAYGPDGKRLIDWLQTSAKETIRSGQGKVFVGGNPNSLELFYLTARGLTITGIGVKVYSMLELLAQMDNEGDRDEFYREATELDVLFLCGFYEPDYPEGFTDRERMRMEWFLRRHRLERTKSIFMHISVDVLTVGMDTALQRSRKWWSHSFIRALEARTETMLIK